MLTRLETIRRLVLASACWSSCIGLVVSRPTHLAAADRNPTPRKLWSPLKGRPVQGDEPKPLVPAARPLSLQPVAEKKTATESSETAPAAKTTHDASIKLNYLSAEWSKVLEDVAKASNSKLVPMDMPPGRYTRQDWRGLYTRTEAVQILNRELEPLGFRVLEKDDFLTVIHVQRQRMEYQRPLQAAAEPVAPRPLAAGHEAGVTTALAQNVSPRGGIQRANFEQEGEVAPQPAAAQPAIEEQPPVAVPAAAVMTPQTFDPMHRSALELSKQVLRAFDSRKEMVDSGPSGLPGFEVFGTADIESGERGGQLFALELDVDNNRIFIHGKSDVADRMVKLLARLDGLASTNAGQSVQVIPGDEPAAEIATRIRPVVKQLAQFQQGAQGAGNATRPDAPAEPPVVDPNADPDVIDAVQSNVIIEVYEGSIILRGTKKDVDAVTRMIRAIEAAADGSLPEVNLVILDHADAGQLATIINQVYTDLATLRNRTGTTTNQKQVTAIAINTPNALLVLSPETQLEAALEVIKKLDVPVSPELQMQVFPMRYAVADQVRTHVETLFPSEATDLSPSALVVADIRSNSLIVMARPRDMRTIDDLVKKLDRDQSASVVTQRQFQLQFAVAQELASFLSLSIQTVLAPPAQQTQQGQGQVGGQQQAGGGTTQAPEQLRTSKGIVLEFLSSDGNSERIVRSGLLSDVRIVAEPRTNSLMVSAPEQSMPLLAELIRVLDVQSRSVSEFKVIKLFNADALSAVDLLNQLFGATGQAGGQQGGAQQGIQLQGAQDVSSSLVPVQFAADARTNSVIASGGTDAMELVEAILAKLDSENALSRSTEVIRLRNTSADAVQLALNTFLQQVRELAQIDPERTTTNQLLQQEILVASEPATNNLIVSATPRYMDDLKRIINQLDREPDQVMIQAILVEVTLTGNCEFGVELGFQDSILFDRSVAGVPGFLFNNSPLGNNVTTPNPSLVGGQGLSSFGIGRTSNEAGFGGLVLAASSNSVSVLIRALEANSNAQVLSRPSILALDNQIAEITVGQLVPRSTGVTFSQLGQPIPTIADTPVGIILSVIPRITPEGKIIMELIANNSALSDQSVPIFVNADGSTVDSPIINQSRAQTTVKVPDGQTIVVGGMITSTDRQLSRKVPWLGDLPVIGHAFRFDQNVNNRTELIIFLTPRIVRRDLDSEIIKQVEAERLNFFETDVETMHGPLFGVPRPDWTPGCPPEGLPVIPGTTMPSHLPAGSIGPDGQVPTGPGIPSMQLDYLPQPPVPMVEPGTNSRRVRGEYGEAFGRRPLPH